MSRDWKQWEGQTVNGTFPLRQYLGGSEHSAVFLTERRGREPQRAVIKLIPSDPATAGGQLARWEATAKLSHPHLLRLFETGSCQLDKSVFLYVVMEYAEDNLALILPHRALTPEEVRDLLEPALDALTFVHGKSLIHGRLKPSNVMAAQDQLKLSSDSLFRSGDPAGKMAGASKYDAPEVATGNILPASDAWSLGMTLMEALTQRLPAVEGITEPLPETVPAPFMGITHCCLRRDPQRRCTVADIANRLRLGSSAPRPATVRVPAASASWRYGILIAVALLAVATFFVGSKLLSSRSGAPPASSVLSQPAPAPATAEPSSSLPEPATVATQSKPSAIRQRDELPVSKPSVSSPAPPPAPTISSSGGASDHGRVLQQVEPIVSRSARNTISGTIRIMVKVDVDAAGNVEKAAFVTEGPSKYFARQAMEAAQQWKFAPAGASRQGASTAWILKFGFKRSGTEMDSEPAKP